MIPKPYKHELIRFWFFLRFFNHLMMFFLKYKPLNKTNIKMAGKTQAKLYEAKGI